MILGGILNISFIAPPVLLKVFFDYAIFFKDYRLLLMLAIFPLGIMTFLTFVAELKKQIDLYLSQQLCFNLYHLFYSKVHKQPISFFIHHNSSDIIYRMTEDLNVVENTVLNTVPSFYLTILQLFVMILICFFINIPMAFILIFLLPLFLFEVNFFAKKLKQLNLKTREKSSEMYGLIEDRIRNIKLIKISHKWKFELNKLLKKTQAFFLLERRVAKINFIHNLFSSYFHPTLSLLLIIYLGYEIIYNHLSIGAALAFASYLMLLKGPAMKLNQLYTSLYTSEVSLDRIISILQLPEEEIQDNLYSNEQILFPEQPHLRFENVSFQYEEGSCVLNDISFDLPFGKSLAIVGKSGIGKSSITDLILGFYKPCLGQISISNMPLSSFSLKSIRQDIALITHTPFILQGTIFSNIVYSSSRPVCKEAVISAAKLADAHEFIMSLPQGYDTNVGIQGEKLSSGQKQRIAIARALLLDPKIIIFDEAIANIDNQSEHHIQTMLKQFHGKKPIIFIAHKLSTIQSVDSVIVIGRKGNIIEKGNITHLMNQRGVFNHLYHLQLSGFHQFFQHLTKLMKVSSRYSRNLSVAVLKIIVVGESIQNLRQYQKFLNDLNITFEFILKDSDISIYEPVEKWWIAFPETSCQEAESLCNQLADYVKQISPDYFSASTINVLYHVISVTSCHTEDDVVNKLNQHIYAKQYQSIF